MKLWGKAARKQGTGGKLARSPQCSFVACLLLLASVCYSSYRTVFPPAVQYMAIGSVSVCGQALA